MFNVKILFANLIFSVKQIIYNILHLDITDGDNRFILSNDTISYYYNGTLHRDDGPAREYVYGHTEYWINGNHIKQLDGKHIYNKEDLAKYLLLV